MKKSEEYALRMKCGDPSALCGIADYTYNDGPARGVRAIELKNGRGLNLTFLADRGLDIPYLSYKGVNMGLLNKVGVRSPHLFQEEAFRGFLKQFYAGMLTTCGLTYAGAAGEDAGRMLGLHGVFDNLPAAGVTAWKDYEGDDAVLRVAGQVREAEVFGPNMVMTRRFTLDTERDCLHIHDVVENQGFATEPLMLIYHINFGYPMLDAGARTYYSTAEVSPRTEFAAEGMGNYDLMEAPEIGRDEQCYYHTGHGEGEAFAMLHNERLGMAAVVRYDKAVFPLLCEWKCMRAGEYALGLEPTTSGVVNRAEARENGLLTYLEPGESRTFDITLEFTDDPARIDAFKARAHRR